MVFKIPDPPKPSLDGYRDWEFLARGGEGAVWRATDSQGVVVVVKHHHNASQWRAESDALRAVDSPYVVKWIACDENEQVIVREYIVGRRADHAIDSDHNSVDWRRGVLESATALLDILDANYTPADLQLANIVVSAVDGRAVVIDLGHSRPGRTLEWLTPDSLRHLVLSWRGHKLVANGNEPHEEIRARSLRELEPALADVVEALDFTADPIRTFVEKLPSTS